MKKPAKIASLFSLVVLSLLLVYRQQIWHLHLEGKLCEAIDAGRSSDVQVLLQRGADPNSDGSATFIGGTPLIWATKKSDLKIMQILISSGANVNKRTDYGYTALMLAPTPESARLLIKHGANVNLKNASGKTAYQCAVDNGLHEVVKVLK